MIITDYNINRIVLVWLFISILYESALICNWTGLMTDVDNNPMAHPYAKINKGPLQPLLITTLYTTCTYPV